MITLADIGKTVHTNGHTDEYLLMGIDEAKGWAWVKNLRTKQPHTHDIKLVTLAPTVVFTQPVFTYSTSITFEERDFGVHRGYLELLSDDTIRYVPL